MPGHFQETFLQETPLCRADISKVRSGKVIEIEETLPLSILDFQDLPQEGADQGQQLQVHHQRATDAVHPVSQGMTS